MSKPRRVIIRDSQTGATTEVDAEHLSIEVCDGSAKIPLFEGKHYNIENFTKTEATTTPAFACA
jgi:hypothetical protein